jgi:hypothetical protein
MDLIALYRTEGFHFQKEMKKALISYASGQKYEIQVPKGGQVRKGYVPKIMQMHISIGNTDEEKEAVALLQEAKIGLKNSFLKALFRSCLPVVSLNSYMDGDGLVMKKEDPFDLPDISDERIAEIFGDETEEEAAPTDAPEGTEASVEPDKKRQKQPDRETDRKPDNPGRQEPPVETENRTAEPDDFDSLFDDLKSLTR